MPKDIVIIPASGQIEFSGSSTHHNVLTVDSSSISIDTNEFRIIGGNIVAEQYVVSSSVTHMTSSAMSGSTIFGDSTDDKHQFTGSIELSGSGDLLLEDAIDGGAGGKLLDSTSQEVENDIRFELEYEGEQAIRNKKIF